MASVASGLPRTHRRFLLFLAAALCIWQSPLLAGASEEQASRTSISLSGTDWRVHDDPDGKGAERRLFEADTVSPEWIPATVPGNIQADLEAAHLLKPLWYGAGDPRLQEVARKDWWYRKDFTVPQSFAGKRVKLVFDGVDHECEIYLNGVKIGGHAGMYRQVGYDVGPALRPDQVNRLAVRIARMPPSLDRHIGMPSQIKVYRHELSEIKCPSFGLDWGIGVYSLGIWKDVRLEASGPARIDYVQVQTKLDAPWRKATVVVRLEVDSQKQLAAQARFRIEGHGAGVSTDVAATLSAGFNQIEASLDLDQPVLWWPSGQGDQPLYQLVSELVGEEGKIIHSRTTRFGVRNITWVQVEGAPDDASVRSQLVVNGRKVRLLGTNIIPADLLPGRQHAKADWLLRMAHAAGMNVVRNWGGGVTMRDGWYDLADELGIMIQQEMPTTNSGEPWPAEYSSYTAAMERTAVSIVKQLRNHPSIVEWTGGNEMGWPGNDSPIPTMLRKLVAEMDGRIFRVTDPAPGWKHGPYDAGPEEFYRIYNGLPAVRCDEFGAPGPAHLETWHRDIPPASQWPLRPDDRLLMIKKVFCAFSGNAWLQPHIIKAQFGPLPDLPSVIKAGQWISADELRYAIDGIRRGGPRTSGFMNWVFNEPWSNGAGNTVVDYDGRPLMNYYLAKQALTPISLSLKFDSLRYKPDEGLGFEVWLTSDAPWPATGLSWQVLARDRHGKVFGTRRGKADIAPLQAKRLDAISLAIPAQIARGPVFVETQLLDSGGATLQERLQAFGCGSLSAPFRGLLAGPPPDGENAPDDTRRDGPPNLAAITNGAKPATATSSRTEPSHQPAGINDGKYGNNSSWIPVSPKSSFQIELREAAAINLFKLSRDRNGQYQDRWVDYLKIESSQDGSQWHTGFEKSGIRKLPDFNPDGVMTIRIEPTPARFVRVTVEALSPETGEFPCIDEFEIFATGQARGPLPPISFSGTGLNEWRPVARTMLDVSPLPTRVEGGQEILGLRVRNTGGMTALFCEPHPLIEYRTDLFIENNHCFIPPGESRTIRIQAAQNSPRPPVACDRMGEGPEVRAGGLSLAETGWRITTWNADDVVVEPSADVLLAVGRRDQMCREYLGYFDPKKIKGVESGAIEGTRPDMAKLPFLLDNKKPARFEFQLSDAQAKRPARLRIHTADQAQNVRAVVEATVNGKPFEQSLPEGLGIQNTDPAHLAFPATAVIEIPQGVMKQGTNVMKIRLKNDGWFTWDSITICTGGKYGEGDQ
jgi:beta-mannosidase